MRLKPNTIRYGQDHCQHCGVPPGVDFRVERLRGAASVVFVLTACGYGCLRHRNCFGNGNLYIWGLTVRQRRRMEAAEVEGGGK